MTSRADTIARAVLTEFEHLPRKRKPLIRNNGNHEWVPLSGIVAEKDGVMICLALATGMKCLPCAKVPESNGIAVHDWHAEVLAIRTFNRYLLDECRLMMETGRPSDIVQVADPAHANDTNESTVRFAIRGDVKLHMYCSEAPCGDASMELTMAAQDDASPWAVPQAELRHNETSEPAGLPGRAYFSQLGVVRRKPARGDAPPTLSKSCSDKLALRQCTSLLSSLTSLMIDPDNAYIDTIVLPTSQFSSPACQRAFSAEGRMKPMEKSQWAGGYAFKPFHVETTNIEFEYSRRSVQARSSSISASNLAALWSRSGVEETLLGGILQGRRAFEVKGASRVSRREMWIATKGLASRLSSTTAGVVAYLDAATYRHLKDGPSLVNRRTVKDDVRKSALVGWTRNEGGSEFSIGPDNVITTVII